MDMHRVLDQGRGEGLLDYRGLDVSKSSSHLEFLVGLDQCSYRQMPNPCQTVFGDRSIKITNKRYKSKLKMLEVYKEALGQAPLVTVPLTPAASTIFDLKTQAETKDDDQISRLRSALRDLTAKEPEKPAKMPSSPLDDVN